MFAKAEAEHQPETAAGIAMRQLLLAALLLAVPVALFWGGRAMLAEPATATASLGDLGPMRAIVSDVQADTARGDIAAAQARVTDFETAWDDAETELRPKDPVAWGQIDAAADAALDSLRTGKPNLGEASAKLAALDAALADPAALGSANGTVAMVAGIAVTDAGGHPLPCEDLLRSVRGAMAAAPADSAAVVSAEALVSQATERCNADDDRASDAFSAQALAGLASN